MFRVKTSQANKVFFQNALFFWSVTTRKFRAFSMRKFYLIPLVSATIGFLSLVISCGGGTSNINGNAGNADIGSSNVSTRRVTDDLGRSVLIPTKVSRIVSTAPSVTEMIFAAGGGDRLVGVTTFCNFPEEAKSIAKIGDTTSPNMEAIVALKPDIVFVSTASQIEAFTKMLEQNGIAVFVSNPSTLDGVLQNLHQLGDILGTTDRAGQAAADLKRRIGAVWAKLQYEEKVRVFVQISREPLFTIGKGSFLNEPIAKAGGLSVTADIETAFPKFSKETALTLRPEAIILSDSPDNLEPNEAFRNSPAVRNGRVYKINADVISRPGPRLVEALEQIAKLLHPEKLRNNE